MRNVDKMLLFECVNSVLKWKQAYQILCTLPGFRTSGVNMWTKRNVKMKIIDLAISLVGLISTLAYGM